MDQLATIAVFIFFIVLRAFVRPGKFMERMKNRPPYPIKKGQEAKAPLGDGPARGYEPIKKYEPLSAYKPRSSHGEDSIVHDHWESIAARSFHEDWHERPATGDTRDADRIHLSENEVDMAPLGSVPELLPEMNAQGIVRAIIMQEVLGQPKSLRKR